MSSQRDKNRLRRDEVEPPAGGHILSDSEDLKGIPVFSTAGRRLGFLDRVIVHRATGGAAFLVLVRRRFFGLLRERLIVPHSALRASGTNGGFTVEWPLRETRHESVTLDPPPAPSSRLDPARGDDASPD